MGGWHGFPLAEEAVGRQPNVFRPSYIMQNTDRLAVVGEAASLRGRKRQRRVMPGLRSLAKIIWAFGEV